MTVGTPTLSESTASFVASQPAQGRTGLQQELNRFVRWFGPNQPLEAIDARALESYQEQVINSGADQSRRLDPVRAFLTYAQRQGLVSGNLAKYIKLKRSSTRRETKGGAALREQVTHLTPEGYAKLKDELERLIDVERPKVAQALWEARQDKDIRENAPYDAAKQHQALVEARIRELERLIATASIIQADPAARERITVGSKVILRDLTHDEELRYTLVGPQEANPRTGKISMASPVGRALLDHGPGETVDVEAPMGTVRYRIEKIEE